MTLVLPTLFQKEKSLENPVKASLRQQNQPKSLNMKEKHAGAGKL